MTPEKARSAVAKAMREGSIEKLPCAQCGSEKSMAHHDDYNRPLDVVWLCRRHHAARHRELGWGVKGNRHPEAPIRVVIENKTSSRVKLLWAISGAGLSMPAFSSLLLDEAVTAREVKLERSKSRRRGK